MSHSHAAHGHADGHADGHGHGHVGHVVPTWLLGLVLVGLLILTGITVGLSGVPMGRFNTLVAMAIATVKATLVVMYFMHLRWDRPFNAIVLVSSVLFVALFVGLAMLDTATYQDLLITPEINRR